MISLADVLSKLDVSMSWFMQVLLEFAPLLIFIFILPLMVMQVIAYRNKRIVRGLIRAQLMFYSIMGMLIAYLTHLAANTVIEGLLPSLVILLTFFFQLHGRSTYVKKPPLRTQISYSAGLVVALSFTISVRYFTLIFGQVSSNA